MFMFRFWEHGMSGAVRIIARSALATFWLRHPETRAALRRWLLVARAADWASTNEVQGAFPKAKVLNAGRVRFEVAGGNHRLIVAFDFERQIAFIKFVGSHAENDRMVTVSLFSG